MVSGGGLIRQPWFSLVGGVIVVARHIGDKRIKLALSQSNYGPASRLRTATRS
jgi:hypothetical protein